MIIRVRDELFDFFQLLKFLKDNISDYYEDNEALEIIDKKGNVAFSIYLAHPFLDYS